MAKKKKHVASKKNTKKYEPIVFIKGKDGRWRWHGLSKNGNLIALCAEGDGFKTRQTAVKNYRAARKLLMENEI